MSPAWEGWQGSGVRRVCVLRAGTSILDVTEEDVCPRHGRAYHCALSVPGRVDEDETAAVVDDMFYRPSLHAPASRRDDLAEATGRAGRSVSVRRVRRASGRHEGYLISRGEANARGWCRCLTLGCGQKRCRFFGRRLPACEDCGSAVFVAFVTGEGNDVARCRACRSCRDERGLRPELAARLAGQAR